jgi:outer membrane protein TolC
MFGQRCLLIKLRARPGRWLVLPLLVGSFGCQARAQAVAGAEAWVARTSAPSSAAGATLEGSHDLADCLQLALQRQPRIAVARSSLAAAEEGKQAIDNLRIPEIIDREIPYRRKQASLGVAAAAVGVDREEHETIYAVTRAYLGVLYARQQERIASGVVERLSAVHSTAEKQLKEGARDITAADVKRALVYVRQAQTRQIQAAQGAKRALASLREAIGVGSDAPFDVPAGTLPDSDVRLSRDEVLTLALARRGDLAQAGLFAQATCLEIEAQGTSLLNRKSTFAAGADIHAKQVPQEYHNGEYRPGAVPPEMPTMLVGSRAERVKRAEALHDRAEAAVEVTRNVITLEAESAFLRWEEASEQVPQAREAADAADQTADDLTRDYTAGLKVRTEDVINARVLAAQSRALYNQYLYNKVLALADLERITAGGFCARLTPDGAGGK